MIHFVPRPLLQQNFEPGTGLLLRVGMEGEADVAAASRALLARLLSPALLLRMMAPESYVDYLTKQIRCAGIYCEMQLNEVKLSEVK